jgi:hypothetical protein
MKRIKLTDNNISPNQRRLRLIELSGIQITDKQKKRLEPRTCLNEVVSMVEIPVNRMGVVPSKQVPQPEDNGGDLRDDSESDNEEDGNVIRMSKMKLKQLIRDIVLDTLKEENTFN